jgi:hypothetical protein
MNNEAIQAVAKRLNELGGKCQFASFVYVSKSSGEKARFTFALGAKYLSLLEASILEMETRPKPTGEIEAQAFENVLASLKKSLEAQSKGEQSEDYTKKGQYLHIAPNLQLNLNDNTLEISGKLHAKTILEAGQHKTVNSRPLTIAQNAIKNELPVSKWRTLAVDFGAIETAKINGDVIEF